MDSIRSIMKRRDGMEDSDIDELIEQFREDVEGGMDPEELMVEYFGLEPDYLFDPELDLFR